MAGFSSDKPVEEEQVRTEEVDSSEEADLVRNVQEEQVRTEKDDSSVETVEEQRVRTEEAAPAKTTEEEEDVRTDKDDSVRNVKEERVRTEEADPAKTTDEEGVRTDEDAPREEAIESLLDSVPNISALNLDEESDERSANPQEDSTTIPTSDQTRSRVTELPLQNPQNNFNQPFGVQPVPPGWFVMDHIFVAGFDPNDATWRPQVLRPNQTTSRDQQHPMAHQLANIVRFQNQMFVPRPLFVASRISFVPPQPHLNAIDSSTYQYCPYMVTEPNQLNLMRPHFRTDQMFALITPSGQGRRFLVLPYHPLDQQRRIVYSLDDAVVFAPPLELSPEEPWPELNHQQMQPHRFYQGPHLFFPVDIYYHPAYSNATAPRPAESNHQQGQQHEPQTQDQSQRFDAGGSSRQAQDQQQL